MAHYIEYCYKFPIEMVAELDYISRVTNHSHGYSLRMAVALLEKAVRIQSEGGNILSLEANGKLTEIVGLGVTTK